MRISDWSSDVCSSDVHNLYSSIMAARSHELKPETAHGRSNVRCRDLTPLIITESAKISPKSFIPGARRKYFNLENRCRNALSISLRASLMPRRSEEHTSELPSLMRTA